jgi:hypothetical protein
MSVGGLNSRDQAIVGVLIAGGDKAAAGIKDGNALFAHIQQADPQAINSKIRLGMETEGPKLSLGLSNRNCSALSDKIRSDCHPTVPGFLQDTSTDTTRRAMAMVAYIKCPPEIRNALITQDRLNAFLENASDVGRKSVREDPNLSQSTLYDCYKNLINDQALLDKFNPMKLSAENQPPTDTESTPVSTNAESTTNTGSGVSGSSGSQNQQPQMILNVTINNNQSSSTNVTVNNNQPPSTQTQAQMGGSGSTAAPQSPPTANPTANPTATGSTEAAGTAGSVAAPGELGAVVTTRELEFLGSEVDIRSITPEQIATFDARITATCGQTLDELVENLCPNGDKERAKKFICAMLESIPNDPPENIREQFLNNPEKLNNLVEKSILISQCTSGNIAQAFVGRPRGLGNSVPNMASLYSGIPEQLKRNNPSLMAGLANLETILSGSKGLKPEDQNKIRKQLTEVLKNQPKEKNLPSNALDLTAMLLARIQEGNAGLFAKIELPSIQVNADDTYIPLDERINDYAKGAQPATRNDVDTLFNSLQIAQQGNDEQAVAQLLTEIETAATSKNPQVQKRIMELNSVMGMTPETMQGLCTEIQNPDTSDVARQGMLGDLNKIFRRGTKSQKAQIRKLCKQENSPIQLAGNAIVLKKVPPRDGTSSSAPPPPPAPPPPSAPARKGVIPTGKANLGDLVGSDGQLKLKKVPPREDTPTPATPPTTNKSKGFASIEEAHQHIVGKKKIGDKPPSAVVPQPATPQPPTTTPAASTPTPATPQPPTTTPAASTPATPTPATPQPPTTTPAASTPATPATHQPAATPTPKKKNPLNALKNQFNKIRNKITAPKTKSAASQAELARQAELAKIDVNQCLTTVRNTQSTATQRADALLELCTAYSNFSAQDKLANASVALALSGGKDSPAQQIANDLFAATRDPNLPKAEREKAGELLGKMYKNPEIPQSTKDMILSQVQTMAHEACVAGASARFGLSVSDIEKMMPPNGIAQFTSLTRYNPEETRYKPLSEEEEASAKQPYTVDSTYRSNISEYANPKPEYSGNPPTVFLKSSSDIKDLEAETPALMLGLTTESFDGAYQRTEKLLSLLDDRNFDLPASLLSVTSAFTFSDFGLGTIGLASTQACSRGVMYEKTLTETLEKAVKKTMQEYNKDPASNTMTDAQKQNIEKAWKIATGETRSFDEIAAQFKS